MWDRNDFDGDGNFDEPDGYLDHFQIVHSGGDQADGDPVFGEDAAWSHRSFVFQRHHDRPRGQPPGRHPGRRHPASGSATTRCSRRTAASACSATSTATTSVCRTSTTPPVAATTASTGGRLMAQQRVSGPGEVLGSRVNDMDPWSKLQLGWLDYETVVAGQNKTLNLGPHEYNSAKPQGAVVVLPDKDVTFDYGAPFAGENQWWSTSGDDLDTTMTRDGRPDRCHGGVADAQGPLRHRGRLRLPVHAGVDRRRRHVDLARRHRRRPAVRRGRQRRPGASPARRRRVAGHERPAGLGRRPRCSCGSGTRPTAAWRLLGFFADEISVVADGPPVFTDGAEDGDNGWTLDGFRTAQQTETAAVRPVLHRVEPHVRVLRQVHEDRPVQLRRPGQAELGRALPVRDRSRRLVLGHLAAGQQHQRAPGRGPDPPDRRAPRADLQPGGPGVA